MTTTCQICGREIKAKSGLIAHHGYRLPWGRAAGARTRSCPGTRYPPYEVSRNAIPFVRADYENQRKVAEQALAKWLAEPPDTIVVVRENAWKTKKTETTLLSRPAGFDPERNAQQGHYRFMSYELEYNTRRRRMCDNIAGLTEAIAWLTARYDSWRAPDAQD